MMTLLRRLFRRENFVTLFLVAAAILSILGIPQRLGISETKMILAMVGFLAIDSLIEKIGYLEVIDARVRRIEHEIVSHPNTVILQTRSLVGPFSDRIVGVKDVFVFAVSANALLMQYARDIERALRAGTNFRFLLVSPDNPALHASVLSSPTLSDVDTQIRWIHDSIEMLKGMAQRKPKGELKLCLFEGLPTTSLIAYDIDRDTGWIQVEPHVYRRTPASRPLFTLLAGTTNEWFDFYREMIAELWDESKEVPLQ